MAATNRAPNWTISEISQLVDSYCQDAGDETEEICAR
jgi:hypothetical protein